MFNREVFSSHLRVLRTSHALSNSGLAPLLGLKNRTSISGMETGKILPSIVVLNDIADLFGVLSDWLLGRIATPYSNESLSLLEKEHINRILATTQNEIPDFALAYIKGNDTYRDLGLREKYFSLPLRANIIFMLNKLRHETDRFIESEQPYGNGCSNFEEFKNKALPDLLEKCHFYKKAKNDNMQQLEKLFYLSEKILVTQEITTPIFNI